jgi:S1-C subfamily serine protease
LTPLNLLRAIALVGAAAVMMCTAPMAGPSSKSTSPPPVRSASTPAYLGVQAGDVSSGGAVVLNVAPGGPADSARIQVGDIITAINGHSVADASALQIAIAGMAPRSDASLTIERNGTTMTVHVMLGTLPAF